MLDSKTRKEMPVFRGALRYFPEALMLVAMLSQRADRKHSPEVTADDLSRPQWVKGKSGDHEDCLARHLSETGVPGQVGEFDPELGLAFRVHVAWRGLAQLQAAIDLHGIEAFFRNQPNVVKVDPAAEEEEQEDWREYYALRFGDLGPDEVIIVERKDA